MDYSAGNVSNSFWFVETRETVRMLADDTIDNIMKRIIEKNVYQQNNPIRAKKQFNVIKKRLEALPDSLVKMIVTADISTAKLIVFVGCMATDRLLFELVYEVYREKMFLGEKDLSDADLNVFFKNKQDQSEKVAKLSDASINKLKQTYCKYMFECGLLSGKPTKKVVARAYIEQDLRNELQRNAMEKYLFALTGEK